jgi:hypothetical protein
MMPRPGTGVLHLVACALIGVSGLALAELEIPEALAPLLAGEQDQRVGRAFVPSPDQRVGEVRLLRRGEADVVQTLLYTKILKRVVGEIRDKEMANWPDGVEGHADAERYAQALAQAQKEIWDRIPASARGTDRQQKLLIEFVLSADAAAVLLAEYEMKEVGGDVQVTARRPLALLDLSRSYIQRNMQLIVADSFRVQGDELQNVLGSLPLVAAAAGASASAATPTINGKK